MQRALRPTPLPACAVQPPTAPFTCAELELNVWQQVGLADTATQRSPRPPLMPHSNALPAPGELALRLDMGARAAAGPNPGLNPMSGRANPFVSHSLPAAGAAAAEPAELMPTPALMSAFASASQIMDSAGSTPPAALPPDFGPADRAPSVSGPLASFPDLASMLGPGTDMFAPDPRSDLGYDVLAGWSAPPRPAPRLAPPATWPFAANAGALGAGQQAQQGGEHGGQEQRGYQQGLQAQLSQQALHGYQQGRQDGT